MGDDEGGLAFAEPLQGGGSRPVGHDQPDVPANNKFIRVESVYSACLPYPNARDTLVIRAARYDQLQLDYLDDRDYQRVV